MDVININGLKSVKELANRAALVNEPLVVVDGEQECMVVLSPDVFERLLFDSNLLNTGSRCVF